MSFNNFLDSIFNSFKDFINHIPNVINILLQNNFIKLIIYIVIFLIIVDYLIIFIKYLYGIFYLNRFEEDMELRDFEIDQMRESLVYNGSIKKASKKDLEEIEEMYKSIQSSNEEDITDEIDDHYLSRKEYEDLLGYNDYDNGE